MGDLGADTAEYRSLERPHNDQIGFPNGGN